jgi:hypothetical protein
MKNHELHGSINEAQWAPNRQNARFTVKEAMKVSSFTE